MKATCFTGHRPNKLGGYTEPNAISEHVKTKLAEAILWQAVEGNQTFITGMAQGVDIWAGEIVMALRARGHDLRLIAAVPFLEQPLVWRPDGWKRWATLLKGCDEIWLVDRNELVTVAALSAALKPLWGTKPAVPEFARKLNLRNEWMVQKSERVIAVWDGTPGGTANCVRYAQGQGKAIIQIHPHP